MKSQMRIYTIKKNELYTFVEEWEKLIKPLRMKIGFNISNAWISNVKNQFIWIMSLDDNKDWESLDKDYHNSDDRKNMNPNPARNIIKMENFFIEEINGY